MNSSAYFGCIYMFVLILLANTSCNDQIQVDSTEPAKAVLIGISPNSTLVDAALQHQFDSTIKREFSNLSEWKVVELSSFDIDLVGTAREYELDRLGIRYFVINRLSVDQYDNLYATVILVDAWTEETLWQEQYSGKSQETARLAGDVAKVLHQMLGAP